ncbi:MAG: MarR family transcriptional regulator [Clostridia bacterium]|nr:MarR family transcriptional regulator [Clostridia bacterium]
MREREGQEGAMTQPGAHLVLSMLALHDGIRQLDLVRHTHLRAPTISAILKKMEGEGLVERKSDPQDMRAVRVYLTEEGRALDRIHIGEIRKLASIALQGLSEEEIGTLMRLLPRIRDNLLSDSRKEEINKEGEKQE